MTKHRRPFDTNIVEVLLSLKWPLKDNEGKDVFIRAKARYESGSEHIAGKRHKLKVRDIQLIPSILAKPLCVIREKSGKRRAKIFFGRKAGKNKDPFMKIVVLPNKKGQYEIVTIVSCKRVK